MRLRALAIVVALAALGASFVASAGQSGVRRFAGSIEHPAIDYAGRPAADVVSTLARRIEVGAIAPKFDAESGYLRALLEALHVPVESQLLVFSRNGIQQEVTGPKNPRALFFNDAVVVGYIRGAPFLELAAHDPRQGVLFYTLNQIPAGKPALVRRNECLSCHDSLSSLDVPGMLVRSNVTAADGHPLRQRGSFIIDHRSPFEQRWGGWYVTGSGGTMRHLGNVTVADAESADAGRADAGRADAGRADAGRADTGRADTGRADTETSESTAAASTRRAAGAGAAAALPATPSLMSVESQFTTRGYLSVHSDIVALMVFEHQMRMINLITRVGWDARVAQVDARPKPASGPLDFTAGPLREAISELVDYLLFVDEAPLSAKIQGASGFAETFGGEGPRDRQGRSLRQLDLTTRLMRYPCSYMIYGDAFDGLPGDVRDAIYRRMWIILSGQEKDPRYARLSAADGRAIVEILRETKKGLPDYFR